FSSSSIPHQHPPSFPTRRSSDLKVISPLPPTLAVTLPSPATSTAVSSMSFSSSVTYALAALTPSPSTSTSSSTAPVPVFNPTTRSEEHTSELQSREKLVCRLLLE